MPCSQTRFRHSCTVGRLTPSSSAIDTLSWPARAPKIIRQRSATCCGVPYEDSHFSSCVRSAGCNLIARLVFGMSEIIAIARKSVKLFKGHYTSGPLEIDRPWDSHADDQLGLMDHLGINKFMVMGFCIGGPFIWNLLKR